MEKEKHTPSGLERRRVFQCSNIVRLVRVRFASKLLTLCYSNNNEPSTWWWEEKIRSLSRWDSESRVPVIPYSYTACLRSSRNSRDPEMASVKFGINSAVRLTSGQQDEFRAVNYIELTETLSPGPRLQPPSVGVRCLSELYSQRVCP